MATPAQLAALKKARAARKKKTAAKKGAPVKRSASAKRKPAKTVTVYRMAVFKGSKKIGWWTGSNWDSAQSAAHHFETLATLKKALPAAKRKTSHQYGIGYDTVKKRVAGKGYARNPVPASKALKAKDAIALYEDFSGHAADYYENIPVDWMDVGLKVGKCDGILYSTVRDGKPERYIHKFKNSARPILAASHDGEQLALVGGDFRFTNRGIVDN